MATPINVSMTAPTDWTAQQEDILRRRKIAEMLQKESFTPVERFSTNGIEAPTSPTQVLAKLMQAYVAKGENEKLTQESKDLGAGRSKALADALGSMPQMQPAGPLPDPQENQQAADQGTPPVQQRPAVQPSMGDNAQWLGKLLALGPDATQAGGVMLGMQQKKDENQLNRESRTLDKILQLEDRAEQAKLSREEKAARQEEASQLRRDLQANSQEFARQSQKDRAAMRPERPMQPLVPIIGPDGKETLVERQDAVGKMPAGAGSKAALKEAGQADVDKDVIKLKSMLDTLKEGGGITDTGNSALKNAGAWIGSSAVGQVAGSMVGSKNQSARNELLMIRPSLLRSIMSSTGMSAKQMDSNAELKLWLSTATDPTKDYQANVEALNNIAEKYGSGSIMPGRSSGGQISPKRRATDTQGGPKFLGFE